MKIQSILLNSIVWLWAKVPLPLRELYYRSNAGFSLGRLLLPDRLELIRIKGGINEGMKMRFNPNLYRDYYFGSYEKNVQSVLTKVVRKGMTVYNIGANLGYFTLALSQIVRPEGFVVAFEPNPGVRERLIEHVYLNNLNNYVRVEEYALTDFDGHADFSLSLGNGRGRFDDLPDVKPGYAIQVPCKRLDTYIAEQGPNPDFLMIDVEYAEGRVLRGMAKTLNDYRPIIVVEMHSRVSIKEALKVLKKHDYFVLSIPGFKILNNLDKIKRGHYLTAHSSYLTTMNLS